MFQAVVHSGSRSELGQHYTSVPKILKTIELLFLDDLKQQFEAAYGSAPRLEKLLHPIDDIKVYKTFMPRRIQMRANYDLAA